MSRFDQMIESMKKENTVPEKVQVQFQKALNNLPEKKMGIQWRRYAAVAAMLAMCSGVVLMSGSVLAAEIPFLGKIFEAVENLHFFPGNYHDKSQVLEQTESTQAESEGIKITASEIYSDGFSVYVTVEIIVEEGGLNNIPGDIAHKSMYLMGNCQIEGSDTVFEMENDNLYGTIVDDHTFIGMTKLNLGDVRVEEGVLNWKLSTIGYDDETMEEVNGISHRIEGEWSLSLPFSVDVDDKNTVEVNYSKNGYKLEKVVVTPYQVAAFLELPEEWKETYVVAFNQEGEKLEWHGDLNADGNELVANFAVQELVDDSVIIYVFDDMDLWLNVHKSADMNHESVQEAVFSAEVRIK